MAGTNQYLTRNTINIHGDVLASRVMYVIPDSADLAALTMGMIPLIWYRSSIWEYDATGSVANGVDTITSSDGRTYVKQDVRFPISVKGMNVNDPPADPAYGDAYVIGDTPTGAWAGHAKQVVRRGRATWGYWQPREGMTMWDEATRREYRYMSAAWGDAINAQNIGNSEIKPSQVEGYSGVVEAIRNDPPPPGDDGVYIVGDAPQSGSDFAARTGQLGFRVNNRFDRFDIPKLSQRVSNRADGLDYKYTEQADGSGKWETTGATPVVTEEPRILLAPGAFTDLGQTMTLFNRVLSRNVTVVEVSLHSVVQNMQQSLPFIEFSISNTIPALQRTRTPITFWLNFLYDGAVRFRMRVNAANQKFDPSRAQNFLLGGVNNYTGGGFQIPNEPITQLNLQDFGSLGQRFQVQIGYTSINNTVGSGNSNLNFTAVNRSSGALQLKLRR